MTRGSEEFGILALRVSDTKKVALWEVSKLGIRDTWKNRKVVSGKRPTDTRHILEGVNILLTSRISGIHETRLR